MGHNPVALPRPQRFRSYQVLSLSAIEVLWLRLISSSADNVAPFSPDGGPESQQRNVKSRQGLHPEEDKFEQSPPDLVRGNDGRR